VSNPADAADVEVLCRQLGMEYRIIPIEPMLAAYRTMPGFTESRYTLGNLMARIRMTVLYYHANRDNRLVCGTSNRSEYMLGYFTKSGDSAADIQPILHLYKTQVWEMATEMNLPESIVTKVPTAGLWTGQSDEKEIGLPYAEIDRSLVALEANGWKAATPAEEKVLALVKKSTHKRIAAPNLLKVP